MKYLYSFTQPQVFTSEQASKVLPQNFSFLEEKNGQQFLVIETEGSSVDEQVSNLVQQECDRLFFLTGEQLEPKFLRKEDPTGKSTVELSHTSSGMAVKPLNAKIDRQAWHGQSLDVQLRLWQIAHQANLPIAAKIILLFQIIEISYPETGNPIDYPKYKDATTQPDPRTEAKLLRDLAAHGNKKMHGQAALYCQYLGVGESHDPTDASLLRAFNKHLHIIEGEARKAIESSITKKP